MRFPPNVLCVFQSTPECEFVVRFHSMVRGKIEKRFNNYINVPEVLTKDTTLSHLSKNLVAFSDNYEQLVGAAVIEAL